MNADFNANQSSEADLCPTCKKTRTIAHNGKLWCPFCAAFVGGSQIAEPAMTPCAPIWPTMDDVQAFHKAARKGDLEKVKALLKDYPILVFRKDGEKGATPLHRAAAKGHKSVAELLLTNKAEVKAESNDGWTPLHSAAFSGCKDVAELLLANQAEVNAKNNDGRTPLHHAALRGHKEVAELLLANKAEVNAKAKNGYTPLHEAAEKGHNEMTELLLAKKAEVNATDNDGLTTLHFAALKGCLGGYKGVTAAKGYNEVAKQLLANKADVNAKACGGSTPLLLAATFGHRDMAELLLASEAVVNAKENACGQTPLHMAAQGGYKDMVELLLANKAEVNAKNNKGQTPLRLAESEGHKDVVDLLLANKAEERGSVQPSATSEFHDAVRNGHVEMVKVLLKTNPDLAFSKECLGETPLHSVAESRWSELLPYDYQTVVQLLLANKAEVNAKDNWGRTPLQLAMFWGHKTVAELLRRHGGKRYMSGLCRSWWWNHVGHYVEEQFTSLRKKVFKLKKSARPDIAERKLAQPSAAPKRGSVQSPAVSKIHWAALEGRIEEVKTLLKADPDLVFSRDEKGRTPLHNAAYNGHKSVVELLLASNAEVNAKDDKGTTPLRLAGSRGHQDLVELFTRYAKVIGHESSGVASSEVASSKGHKDVHDLVEKKVEMDESMKPVTRRMLKEQYELLAEVGRGGFGAVYKARDVILDQFVAVKELILEDPAPLRAEGKVLSQLRHKNIVGFRQLLTDQQRWYMVMDFVEGFNLAKQISRRMLYDGGGENALKRMLSIAQQAAEGLNCAHEHDIIHQDMKPANVMVDLKGVAKVSDFGLAKARPQGVGYVPAGGRESILVSANGMTPAYCSPEQANGGKLTRKTDTWSWGLSVLEMFVGGVTWTSGTAAREALQGCVATQARRRDVPPLPQGLTSLLERCFQDEPQARPDMGEITAALAEIQAACGGSLFRRFVK
jgi:ankyrin repeat protein